MIDYRLRDITAPNFLIFIFSEHDDESSLFDSCCKSSLLFDTIFRNLIAFYIFRKHKKTAQSDFSNWAAKNVLFIVFGGSIIHHLFTICFHELLALQFHKLPFITDSKIHRNKNV